MYDEKYKNFGRRKEMVSMLDIPKIYQNRLKEVYRYFNQPAFDKYEIYVFGGYARQQVKDTSDIDLLLLTDEIISPKQAKQLRMDICEDYEESIKYAYEVDVKIYGKARFHELASRLSLESEIVKHMVPLKEAVGCE